MKKLWLMPLLTMPLLVGCNDAPIQTMDDWFENIEQYDAECHISSLGYVGNDDDYDLYVANLIKENITDAKIKNKKAKSFEDGYNMVYTLWSKDTLYNNYFMFIYDNKIAASGNIKTDSGEVINQRVVYEAPEENCKAIYEGAKERVNKINKEFKEEKEAVLANVTTENFFKQVDESETMVSIDYNKLDDNHEKSKYHVEDDSILDAIKQMNFTNRIYEKYARFFLQDEVVCTLNENYILHIYETAVDLEYHYVENYPGYDYTWGRVHVYYSLDYQQRAELINKIEASL